MTERGIKSKQTATAEGIIRRDVIHGSELRETSNLITANGMTTELFRPEWKIIDTNIDHVIHVVLNPGAISAWHMHASRIDCIFVTEGTARLVMWDPRRDSPTYDTVSVIHLSRMQPAVATIPNGVWHGFKNIGPGCVSFVNYASVAYNYQDPDEWTLPPDTDEIPYRF